jgi:hypothetical protein
VGSIDVSISTIDLVQEMVFSHDDSSLVALVDAFFDPPYELNIANGVVNSPYGVSDCNVGPHAIDCAPDSRSIVYETASGGIAVSDRLSPALEVLDNPARHPDW